MPIATPPDGSDSNPGPNDDLSDSLDLVRHAQGGELSALGELFTRYYPRVRAMVLRSMNDKLGRLVDAEDIVQEAMLDAIRGFDAFQVRTREELIGWFARIVERRILTTHRNLHAQKRDRDKEVQLGYIGAWMEQSSADFQPKADTPGPHEIASDREQAARFRECLGKLDSEQREVLLLRYEEKLSWARIAERTGRPTADSARMAYVRARIALQKAFQDGHGA